MPHNYYAVYSIIVLLTVLFIVLKVSGVIDWSWVWVLSPWWISVGLLAGVFLIVYLATLIAGLMASVGK